MKRIAFFALASGLAIAAATSADAAIFIGVSVNGGAITQVATDGGSGSANYNVTTGGFFYNVSGTGFPLLPSPTLNTQSVNISSTGPGTVEIFITQTGVGAATLANGLVSSFTSNTLLGVNATITSYLGGSTATPFGDASGITLASFLGSNTQQYSATFPPSGLMTGYTPFNANTSSRLLSETVRYTLNFTGGAGSNFNGTANLTAGVPEPATWGMMIVGFGLMGGVLRRRKTTVAFA